MSTFLHDLKELSDVVTVGLSMQLLGLFCIILLVVLMFSAQRDKKNKIDFAMLLVEPAVGNVTLAKYGGLVALIATTWIIIYLTVTGHFDATAFLWYLTAWCGVKIAADITAKPTIVPGGPGASVVGPLPPGSTIVSGQPAQQHTVAHALDLLPQGSAAAAAFADDAGPPEGGTEAKQLAPKIEQSDVGKTVTLEPPQASKSKPTKGKAK